MLYPNGQRVLAASPRAISGALAQSGALGYGGVRGARLNRFVSETYSKVLGAVPSGYGARAYILPIDPGGLAGFTGLTFTQSATGVLGMPGTGAAEMSFTVADASGQLISSGAGSAAFAITCANLLLTASLGGTGSASFAITAANALLGAEASLIGETSFAITVGNAQAHPLNDASPLRTGAASMAITGTLIPYAIGSMSGSTADSSVLTVDAIAAGVLAAALAAPIRANIKQVNDIAITGDGQPGTEWGP